MENVSNEKMCVVYASRLGVGCWMFSTLKKRMAISFSLCGKTLLGYIAYLSYQ